MTQADGIHVHAFDKQYIFNILCLAQCTSAFRTETMTVHPFNHHTPTVDIQSVTFTCFNGTETKFLIFNMQCFACFIKQGKGSLIHGRSFSRP